MIHLVVPESEWDRRYKANLAECAIAMSQLEIEVV